MGKLTSNVPTVKAFVVVALMLASLAGLTGNFAIAGAAGKATYNVIAGPELTNGVSVLAFSPQTLKVHRGDTVTWQQRGFHNVRFDQKPMDLVAVNSIDGKPTPELNPVIMFPNVKNGDAAKPGTNTG